MLDSDLRAKFVDDGGQHMQLAHDLNNSPRNVLVSIDISLELAQWLDKKIDEIVQVVEEQ